MPCALCKSKRPNRTHVFPQNSRAEVQVKWVKALQLPQEQEDAVLAEMRQLEQKGNRPRWCSFHFEYDSAGIHFPKYFDPEEGKSAQGLEDDDEKEGDEDEQGPSTKEGTPRDRSSTPNEPRRSTRRKTTPKAADAAASPSSPEGVITDPMLQRLLIEAGLSVPGMKKKEETPKASTSRKREEATTSSSRKEEGATSVEKTLQDILMEAGLPVPETLQAKTGVLVDGGNDDAASAPIRRIRHMLVGGKNKITVGDAKRMGTFVPGAARAGGATLSSPKTLMNPISIKFAGNDWPKVIVPKSHAANMSASCYNHNTMEKYDDTDSLRNFKMPCKAQDCRSELTVIMNRARALDDQFEALSSSVLTLVQMYKTKTPQAFRPPQSLATVQGRAAAVAGPVYGNPNVPRHIREQIREIPIDSLSVQERRIKKVAVQLSQKDPQRLLTADDLASTVRRRVARKEQSSAEEDEEEDATQDDDSAPNEDYKPSASKRNRLASDAFTSASEASPPRLEMIE